MSYRAMDCRKIYGFVTFLLIWASSKHLIHQATTQNVPVVSTLCEFQRAQMTIYKIQIRYDQFETDMLNQSYVPKPSPYARICGLMKPGSHDFKEFHNALANCSKNVHTAYQREWNALQVYHNQKCNGVSYLGSSMFLLLLAWIVVPLLQ